MFSLVDWDRFAAFCQDRADAVMQIKHHEAEVQRISDAQYLLLSEAFSDPERQAGLLEASRALERQQGDLFDRIDEKEKTIRFVNYAVRYGIVWTKRRYLVA